MDKNGTVLDLLQEAFIDVSTHSLGQLQLLLCYMYITALHLSCDVQCTLFRLLMYMFLFFLLKASVLCTCISVYKLVFV